MCGGGGGKSDKEGGCSLKSFERVSDGTEGITFSICDSSCWFEFVLSEIISTVVIGVLVVEEWGSCISEISCTISSLLKIEFVFSMITTGGSTMVTTWGTVEVSWFVGIITTVLSLGDCSSSCAEEISWLASTIGSVSKGWWTSLSKEKSMDVDTEINLMDVLTVGISYRESEDGEKDGNFTPYAIPGQVFKTTIKSDEVTEDEE